MDDKEFFAVLKRRLEEKPSTKFERVFWKKFDAEFRAKASASWFPTFSFRWLVPACVAACILVGLTTFIVRNPSLNLVAERQSLQPLLEYSPMLQDYDLFLGEEGEDVASLSDEEWMILLRERNG